MRAPNGTSAIAGAALALCFCLAASASSAAELLMFEQAGCPFCRKFDSEIAPDYPRSRAGRVAPLRRVNIYKDRRGGYVGLDPAVFTPTFVLMDDAGGEVGRLTGYPGERWFYPEIDRLIDRLQTGANLPVAHGTGGAGAAGEPDSAAPASPASVGATPAPR